MQIEKTFINTNNLFRLYYTEGIIKNQRRTDNFHLNFNGKLYNYKATKGLIKIFDNYNEYFSTHNWLDKLGLYFATKIYLKRGANPNAMIDGYPLLHEAILHNCKKVTQLLLENGAKPERCNCYNNNAMQYAQLLKRNNLLNMLQQYM